MMRVQGLRPYQEHRRYLRNLSEKLSKECISGAGVGCAAVPAIAALFAARKFPVPFTINAETLPAIAKTRNP